MNRNYSIEHNRRQQAKKRLAWEVDRNKWESLTKEQQAEIKRKIQQILDEYIKPSE